MFTRFFALALTLLTLSPFSALASEITGTLTAGSGESAQTSGAVTSAPPGNSLSGTVSNPTPPPPPTPPPSGNGSGGNGPIGPISNNPTIVPGGTPIPAGSVLGNSTQNVPPQPAPATSGTPGVPNTGAGGDALTVLLTLFASGISALLGIALLRRDLDWLG
jgi:hypothetical protein